MGILLLECPVNGTIEEIFSGWSKILWAFHVEKERSQFTNTKQHKGIFVFLDTENKNIHKGSLVKTLKKLASLIVPTSFSLSSTWLLGAIYQDHLHYEMAKNTIHKSQGQCRLFRLYSLPSTPLPPPYHLSWVLSILALERLEHPPKTSPNYGSESLYLT